MFLIKNSEKKREDDEKMVHKKARSATQKSESKPFNQLAEQVSDISASLDIANNYRKLSTH